VRIESFSPARLAPPGELPAGGVSATRDAVSAAPGAAPSDQAGKGTFSQVLGNALGQVNTLLQNADQQAQRVATGQAENLHDSLLAAAEADLALQVTMRVTQKAIAAYQEISRMQV
jgi:flagellar hook-basal body complex protein FliE